MTVPSPRFANATGAGVVAKAITPKESVDRGGRKTQRPKRDRVRIGHPEALHTGLRPSGSMAHRDAAFWWSRFFRPALQCPLAIRRPAHSGSVSSPSSLVSARFSV